MVKRFKEDLNQNSSLSSDFAFSLTLTARPGEWGENDDYDDTLDGSGDADYVTLTLVLIELFWKVLIQLFLKVLVELFRDVLIELF